MKIKTRDLDAWHRFFAWWPVSVGPSEFRWLEIVERRRRSSDAYVGDFYDYRALKV